ncbi:aldehyde dehydrogenase family protein [Thiohalobacter sp. IOR34]|uniref:aldehyde dehydrogenase family protein n=1 Tax=Thiohalobacter sp. IOR34 TaxID=3057176 RepID=UPI0025B13C91|nr:aldehyde dehydrogenase family protein [Thiohalobacter sp. IOR34]WJW76737.1 aldehyde dehydrogenase family protein [Thiohalobacter sp. IOR34]
MTDHHPLMVPDAGPASGRLEVRAPFDGQLIATLDTADAAVVERALARAHGLYQDRDGWLPVAERAAILERTARLMGEQAESLALEAAREGGKPLLDSRIEVARAIDGVRNCIEVLRSEAGREIPMGITPASAGRLAMTHKEPRGPVVAVSAFNHPLNLIVHQVGPAVAAGCPVIVKPAEDTPLSCYRFVALLREAGLPDAWCQALVTSSPEVSERLVCDQRVAFFSFIGSARVGWMLRSKLAPGTRCALEHGGVAPVLIEADADLEDALPLIAKGGFYHAGQVCVSVQRVFAPRARAAAIAEGLAVLAGKMRVGDPTDATTEVGPLIREREVQRVHEWVQEAVADGARLLCGGKPLSASCYPPTVLLDPPAEARVSQQEVFGPVICVYGCADTAEAIERANALPYAFQAAVFTRSLDAALDAYRRLDASAVMVNDHTAFRVDWMPFAGLRQSGLGVGGIPYSFNDMQIDKLLVMRSSAL